MSGEEQKSSEATGFGGLGPQEEGVWGDSAPPKKKDLGGHTHHDSVLVLWVWVLGTQVEMGSKLLEMQERSRMSLCKQQSSGSMNRAGP